MVRSPGKVIVSTGALVSSQPAARMASAASICVMPPTSVPQTETFGKMASFFATSTMPTAPARDDDGQHDERSAQGDLAAAAAGFSGFRLRRALCRGCLPGYGRALHRLLRRGSAAGGRLTLCRAGGGAAVRRALLRGEVRRLALCSCAAFGSVAVKFHDFGSCLSLSKSDYLNKYRGKPPPHQAGAWCAAAFQSAASSTGCARPCGRSVPRAACR